MAASVTGRGLAFIRTLSSQIPLRLPWVTTPQQLSCFHTSVSMEGRRWENTNKIVHPPQLPDEPRRPAEIYHSKRQFKYSKDKLWYLAKLVKGLSIDQAIAQLEFSDKKGAKFMKDTLLEAQEMAVRSHNVEYKSNLYVAESFSGKGPPPKKIEKTSFDAAKEYCAVPMEPSHRLRNKWKIRRTLLWKSFRAEVNYFEHKHTRSQKLQSTNKSSSQTEHILLNIGLPQQNPWISPKDK
uniref:Large ribosomal subunit protein uL22m n=1 Tax=Knipowitschia caucasica TaxID=637954 RepID=A0AAV2JDU8_KNICA